MLCRVGTLTINADAGHRLVYLTAVQHTLTLYFPVQPQVPVVIVVFDLTTLNRWPGFGLPA